jgi:uncharacterized membrane protein
MKLIKSLKELNNKDYEFDKTTKIMILLLTFSICGIFGFIYETLFYRIDLGYFVKRGTTFGPWIPIYGFGSLFITLLCFRLKDKPFVIFLLSSVITGVLEYGTGWFCDKILHHRYWDYNTEILNFGNINGYVCFRSVFLFAVAGLFLIYVLVPKVNKLLNKYNLKLVSIILGSLFIIDIILYKIIY